MSDTTVHNVAMAGEARQGALFERSPAMLHTIDREGRLLTVSDRWLEVMGRRREDVVGQPATMFLTERSRRKVAEEIRPRFLETGECREVSLELVAKGGAIIDVLLSATAALDARGRLERAHVALTEVGALRQANEDPNNSADVASRDLESQLGRAESLVNMLREDLDGRLDEDTPGPGPEAGRRRSWSHIPLYLARRWVEFRHSGG